MNLREQLQSMDACSEAVEWVGERTLEQAWAECPRGSWMAWLTRRLHLDSRAAAADMAERVWHLVPADAQLACAWAIDAARRGADADEMQAAAGAAAAAADAAAADAAAAAAAADAAADAAAADDAAADAAAWAADAAADTAWAAAAAAGARTAERAAQADIMREHFTYDQIAKAIP